MMYGRDDYDFFDIEPIEDVARADGFSIDDDGHWVPLEDNEDFEDYGYEMETDNYDNDF